MVRAHPLQPTPPPIYSCFDPPARAQSDGKAPQSREMPEVRLYSSSQERHHIDEMADLFSIIKTVQALENAFVKDAVGDELYTKECKNLITKFKVQRNAIKSFVPNIDRFMKDYNMDCKGARHRLLRLGVPATVEHGSAPQVGRQKSGNDKHLFQAVQTFITTINTLQLDMRDVDQLHPTLSDLMNSLNKVEKLSADHMSRQKVKKWLEFLNQKPASYRLTDEESRQMQHDLQTAYDNWFRVYN